MSWGASRGPLTPPDRGSPKALRAVLDDTPSAEEREWADRVEALRRDLLASTDELQVIDYGAGTRGRPETRDAAYEGRVVHSRVDEICRTTSAPPRWALLLLELVRAFRPASAVELGTSLAVSTAYMAAALELNSDGRLVTLEGAGAVAEQAERNVAQLRLDARVEIAVGRIQDTLGGVLERAAPVDYVFVDGHHDGRDARLLRATAAVTVGRRTARVRRHLVVARHGPGLEADRERPARLLVRRPLPGRPLHRRRPDIRSLALRRRDRRDPLAVADVATFGVSRRP